MSMMRTALLTACLTICGALTAQAADVKIEGVHLCCGSCSKAIESALKDVDGVSDATPDQDAKSVTFKAKDSKAVDAGLKALADAGFHGKATADGKAVKFPEVKVAKGTKSDAFTITGVHLCCGSCVVAVKKAIADVPGVDQAQTKVDKDDGSIVVVGKDVDVAKFLDALFADGFHGEVKK